MLTPPKPPPLPPPAERARIVEHLKEVKRQVRDIGKSAAKGEAHPFTLAVTEQEMNVFLATDNEVRDVLDRRRISQAFVSVLDNRVRVTGYREERGVTLPLTVTFVPYMREDRTLGFRVDSVALGHLRLPGPAERRVADELSNLLERNLLDPHLRFSALRVGDGRIELTGNTR